MINEALGEVELKSRLDDSLHVLSFSPNNLANIEEALKKDLSEIVSDISTGRMSVRTIRTIIKLTYVLGKGARPMTDAQAGDILNAVGYKPVVDALGEGLKWMRVGIDEVEGSANPPAANGDGSA